MPVNTTDDPAFHFPPDVFEALVQAIPLLTRGKKDVLTFLQGCGVSRDYLRTLEPWAARGSDRSKYAITREIVKHLNELGDQGLAARRRSFNGSPSSTTSLSLCYPDNQLKAKGAVSTLAGLVDRKDSFTRMKEQREEDERKHRAEQRQAAERLSAVRAARGQIKDDLYALFGHTNPQQRGKALEGVLNRLFETHDILVREAFVVVDDEGAGVIEQIDGAVEIDKKLYLVEMKWWNQSLGPNEVGPHLVKVYGRSDVGGILISQSGYTPAAIDQYKTALSQRTVILVELREIVTLLERELPLLDLLRPKLQEAALTKRPLTYPLDSQ